MLGAGPRVELVAEGDDLLTHVKEGFTGAAHRLDAVRLGGGEDGLGAADDLVDAQERGRGRGSEGALVKRRERREVRVRVGEAGGLEAGRPGVRGEADGRAGESCEQAAMWRGGLTVADWRVR